MVWFPLLVARPVVHQASNEIIVGKFRIQSLTENLVRVELRGPKGFEDRKTFTVVNRDLKGLEFSPASQDHLGAQNYATKNFSVAVFPKEEQPHFRVTDRKGKVLFEFTGTIPKQDFLPAPSENRPYVMADTPRLIPPAWGATPPPSDDNVGWDTSNSAPDIYVFTGDAKTTRRDFLKLTGSTPIPPLFMFGLIDSRYHPYTEQTALETIDTYRKKKIPLDVFVCDTDWRIGASHGYTVEPKYFPDMQRFLREAHGRNVRIMFNDHPEPQSRIAFDPEELKYRYDNLTKLMGEGVDVWWYDRNWSTVLREPMPGIRKDAWGQRMYHDIAERFRPDRRPVIMGNVEGIDNGPVSGAPHPANHRYPIWWPGDTRSDWRGLRDAIGNMVNFGIRAAHPYVNEDLGGHVGQPNDELYTRYLEYGAFEPVMRLHCTAGRTRYPWAYSAETERIVSEYVRLRYRLMPTLYAAAHENYETGTPMMRRCDEYWPQFPDARSDQQFLVGSNLLVAPTTAGEDSGYMPVPASMLDVTGEYFDNQDLSGAPKLQRKDAQINFDWHQGSPAAEIPTDHFSVRWTGTIGPVVKSGDYMLQSLSDDGVRVWLDSKLVIDKWVPSDHVVNQARVSMEAGKTYSIKVEYYEGEGEAAVGLGLRSIEVAKATPKRTLWVPPGVWTDAWTGVRVMGPRRIEVESPIWHLPLYVREGSAVFSVPQMQFTGEKKWDSVTIDAYPGSVARTSTMFEDDGVSPDYIKGKVARTQVTVGRNSVSIKPMRGGFAGALGSRSWKVRVHLSRLLSPVVNGTFVKWHRSPNTVLVNGKPVAWKFATSRGSQDVPFASTHGAAQTERVIEVSIPNHPNNQPLTVVVR